MLNTDEYKNNLQQHITEIIQTLEKFKDLPNLNLINEQLIESIKSINEIIDKGICHIKKDIEDIKNNISWDVLNIAFFGETNAGKSTLIEALIKGNGSSIGEGRKDYTKELSTKKFKEKGFSNIKLLDMPGIEGNESKYRKEIKTAVEKSHIIFYVIGTDKEPEEGTVRKIKSFLKDEAKVYSILNVSGEASRYRQKTVLKDEKILKIEERTFDKFKGLFFGHYKGNIVLHAKLGFLSIARLNIPGNTENERKFIKDREKTKEVFVSLNNAYNFSNLEELQKTITELSLDSVNEIIVSNTYKFLKSLDSVLTKILREKKNFDKTFKELQKLIDSTSNTTSAVLAKYNSEILHAIEIKIDRAKSEILEHIYSGIDAENDEHVIKKGIDSISHKCNKEIEKECKNLLADAKEEIETLLKEFKKRVDLSFKYSNMKGDIDITKIIEKIEISFKYVMGQITDVGLSVWGVIATYAIHPVVGIITTILFILKKIYDWFSYDPNKRKREAKQKAYSDVESSFNKMKAEVQINIKKEFEKIRSSVEETLKEIRYYLKGIKNFGFSMNEKIEQLNNTKTEISTLLTKYIIGNNVEIAYVDLQLEKMCIIGKQLPDKMGPFRIKDISIYENAGDLLNAILVKTKHDFEKNNSMLVVDKNIDEFKYRALDTFIKRDTFIGLKSVRRRVL
ncbi:MAG: hypothetical protein E3K32_03295 [wastewater metagenome]|nr:hypothetical protein [Candidatus Loosdrechtia aerotolerans]